MSDFSSELTMLLVPANTTDTQQTAIPVAPDTTNAATTSATTSAVADDAALAVVATVPIKSTWTFGTETIAAGLCDNAKAYEWMHETSQSMFSTINAIVMGVVGTISAASSMSNTVISALSTNTGFSATWIFGLVATLQTGFMLAVNQIGFKGRADKHAKYASDWRRIKLVLMAELAMPRKTRSDCASFLTLIRKDFDQVSAASDDLIPMRIRKQCYDKFNIVPDFDIPEICGFMQHTVVYNDTVDVSTPVTTVVTSHP